MIEKTASILRKKGWGIAVNKELSCIRFAVMPHITEETIYSFTDDLKKILKNKKKKKDSFLRGVPVCIYEVYYLGYVGFVCDPHVYEVHYFAYCDHAARRIITLQAAYPGRSRRSSNRRRRSGRR